MVFLMGKSKADKLEWFRSFPQKEEQVVYIE